MIITGSPQIWFQAADRIFAGYRVFRQCQQRADAIMDAGQAQNYRTAAEWLRRGRDILLSAGEKEMWHTYLDQVMDKHQRKYKLMPMLRELCDR